MCRLVTNTYMPSNSFKFYRYDLVCPPIKWSQEFKNPEYVYEGEWEALKIKNQIGAFFFFDNKSTAYITGCKAAKNRTNQIWLTCTSIIKKTSLLDISHFTNISSILLAFDELGIDVLNDRFFKFNAFSACKSFKELRILIDKLRVINNMGKKDNKMAEEERDLVYEIGAFFGNNDRIDYFGQLLTDFNNGIEFKNLLIGKGYNGYIFKESYTSPTYCVFDYSVLSELVVENFKIHE